MACRGVHFALTDGQAQRVLGAEGDAKLRDMLAEIEEAWDGEYLAESDNAWDAMHRCLSDGTLDFNAGTYPLNRCVLGGRQLYEADNYIVSFVPSSDVPDVARALEAITEQWFRERYFALNPDDYEGELGEDDFQYTWDWFQGVRALYLRAAREGRAVVFTVDQ